MNEREQAAFMLGVCVGAFLILVIIIISEPSINGDARDAWVEKQIGYPVVWNDEKMRYEKALPSVDGVTLKNPPNDTSMPLTTTD